MPFMNAANHHYDQRFYKMSSRVKPIFLTQRTRTWKNKSRLSYSMNNSFNLIQNRNGNVVPAAILGTKRADELIAAQNINNNNMPIENSRPILGRKYSMQSFEHCCEKCCGKSASTTTKIMVKNHVEVQTLFYASNNTEIENSALCDSLTDVDDDTDSILPSTSKKIQTMTFTNKVGGNVPPKQQQEVSLPNATITPAAAVIGCNLKTQNLAANGISTPNLAAPTPPLHPDDKLFQDPEIVQGPHYDMCSVLKYALQIMKSESTDSVANEINSTDSQKLMAVHKRLLSMAIWNNNEEIFDESFNEFDEDNDNSDEHELTNHAKPDSLILNSCVFFANGKSLIAPPASELPMPPKHWIQDQKANEK